MKSISNIIDSQNSNKKQMFGGKLFLSKIVSIKISLIIVILGLLTFIVGTSYAVLRGEVSSNEEQVIKSGNVEVLLTEYFDNIDKKVSIMSDTDGLLQEEVYNFNLKNIGEIAGKYKIVLNNEVPDNYTGEVLSNEYIKIGLEVNEEEYGPFTLEEANNILDSGIIYKKELIDYNLRIWLDETATEEISNMDNYKAFLSLDVTVEQRSDSSDEGITKTFSYTGDYQKYMVPRDGYYYIVLGGARGGSGGSYAGGRGTITSGYIELNAGEKLYFYVGGQGTTGSAGVVATYPGGYNGGGQGYVSRTTCTQTAAGGGGATDVRLVSGNWDDKASLISRIMVAAGGGGGYSESCSTSDAANIYGGDGGALSGEKGVYRSYMGYSAYNPTGGTQTTGGQGLSNWTATSYVDTYTGSFGKGGTGENSYSGGGGGYYGGASGVWQPGAGGSSYISGYAGVDSVENNAATITHTGKVKHYSGKYFVGGKMVAGKNWANGYAEITYVGKKPNKNTTNLNNVRYIKNCIVGNSRNTSNHWIELQAIQDGINIAEGKTSVAKNFDETTSYSASSSYPYSRVTDGDITYSYYTALSSGAGTNQCVIVDLGSEQDIDETAVWNYYGDQRAYIDGITYVAGEDKDYRVIINDASVESSNGHRINAYSDTLNGYVQDGLLIWYDGYANTGAARTCTATTWKNLRSSSYSGTVTSGQWVNTSLYFNGTSSWVKIAQVNPTKVTVEAVFNKTVRSSNAESLVSNIDTGGYHLSIAATSYKVYSSVYIGGGYRTTYATEAHPLNKAIYAASTYDQNDIKVYAGGEVDSVLNYPGTITSPKNSTVLALGTNPTGTSSDSAFFKGYIHSIRIYNRALTPEEVKHNYLYDKQMFGAE